VDYMRSLDGKMGGGGIAPSGKPGPTEAELANVTKAKDEDQDVPF